MPQRLRIDHHTAYEYDRPVSLSPHFARVFARTEPGRLVQSVNFQSNPTATVQYRRDAYDNVFARCYYPGRESRLVFDYALEIELREANPFDFLLDAEAANYPFKYSDMDAERLAPYLAKNGSALAGPQAETDRPLLPLPFWSAPTETVPTVTLLSGLVEALHKNLGYERREEGAAHGPAETLRRGRGACRDFAVVLAATLRELGLAARLVSGYLCEFGQDPLERRAEGAMHMWTEVYLPGAGWTGLDPTNGVFCDHNFIATAVGLNTAEITPIAGRYFSEVRVESRLSATIGFTML